MTEYIGRRFDAEREFYGCDGIKLTSCAIDGPADGESAFKEGRNITTEGCRFNLRYPFWHNDGVNITDCEMTPACRAALWYSRNVVINDTRLHGVKAVRECAAVRILNSDIISAEFGWRSHGLLFSDTSAEGEYFCLMAEDMSAKKLRFRGKYSFQYVKRAVLTDCTLDTKDAFWHAEDVTLINCTVRGEYLGWYSKNLHLINCRIEGTQPLCYCTGLKMQNCEMHGADLAFEKSEVEATLTTPVISIKNPSAGFIVLPHAQEIIRDDAGAPCIIKQTETT